MNTNDLGFIGGGRITKIFLQAFTCKEQRLDNVVVYDTNMEVLVRLKKLYPDIRISESVHEAARKSTVFIALHPPVIMETLDKIAGDIIEDAIVVSLAPKITMEKIASKLGTRNIARMIPNATSYINQGYNPISFSGDFNPTGKVNLLNNLKLLGHTFEVSESKLEGYAIISAMLPTYFWFQWKELGQLGVKMGLSEDESKESVQRTLIAAINLMFESGLSPEKVIDLIPVKPIADHESQIVEIYREKLVALFEKIKPNQVG
ncbi:MAG: NAD(P)-binding domain-containing protein [Bacteroidia bacterium]|nr:NAD(P)-binding domain-containing protein [Bacteroidia bacterium]